MKVKPKMVEVEAEQWTMGKKIAGLRHSSVNSKCMELRTTEGPRIIRSGDWLIRFPDGGVCVVPDLFFGKLYELAGE